MGVVLKPLVHKAKIDEVFFKLLLKKKKKVILTLFVYKDKLTFFSG
jgi:hypothetical protein